MICMDPLQTYPGRPHGHDRWCHLYDDGDDLDALHAFAARLGLRRSWFQSHRLLPHYDLTAGKHAQALRLGAKAVTHEEFRVYMTARFARMAKPGTTQQAAETALARHAAGGEGEARGEGDEA